MIYVLACVVRVFVYILKLKCWEAIAPHPILCFNLHVEFVFPSVGLEHDYTLGLLALLLMHKYIDFKCDLDVYACFLFAIELI